MAYHVIEGKVVGKKEMNLEESKWLLQQNR